MICYAQDPSKNVLACSYYSSGIELLKIRDYENAIEELREAVALDNTSVIINRDYAFAYFLNNQLGPAAIIIDKTMELPSADESVFMLACQIYSAKHDLKTAKQSIEIGIEKFPISGDLVSAKAQLLYDFRQDKQAIELWEMALNMQPNITEPYYGIATAYDTNISNLPKTILYAETFLLTEPYSVKANQMKKLLYRCYQALYADLYAKNEQPKATTKKNMVLDAVAENRFMRIIKGNKFILLDGASIANITELRKRCVEDWIKTQADNTMPAVMKYHQRLIHEQLFETYNQWLLGSEYNPSIYKKWATDYEDAIDLLKQFLKENKFTHI